MTMSVVGFNRKTPHDIHGNPVRVHATISPLITAIEQTQRTCFTPRPHVVPMAAMQDGAAVHASRAMPDRGMAIKRSFTAVYASQIGKRSKRRTCVT
ncbi:hypothetical protein ACTBW4_03320 [Roseovarius pacificus]